MSDHRTIVCTAWPSAIVSAGTLARSASMRTKTKARLDPAIGVEAEGAVLVGSRPFESRDEIGKVRQQSVEPGRLAQFGPVADEEDQQVRAQFGVGLGHAVTGKCHHRLDRALENGHGRILHPEDHGRDGPAPACEQELPVGTREKRGDVIGGKRERARRSCQAHMSPAGHRRSSRAGKLEFSLQEFSGIPARKTGRHA